MPRRLARSIGLELQRSCKNSHSPLQRDHHEDALMATGEPLLIMSACLRSIDSLGKVQTRVGSSSTFPTSRGMEKVKWWGVVGSGGRTPEETRPIPRCGRKRETSRARREAPARPPACLKSPSTHLFNHLSSHLSSDLLTHSLSYSHTHSSTPNNPRL